MGITTEILSIWIEISEEMWNSISNIILIAFWIYRIEKLENEFLIDQRLIDNI